MFVDSKLDADRFNHDLFIGKWFRKPDSGGQSEEEIEYDLKRVDRDDDEAQSSDFEEWWGVEREGKSEEKWWSANDSHEDDDDQDDGGEMMPVFDI